VKSILAQRTALIKPSPTLALSAKAKALKAQGHDVVAFAAGEPDFATPEHIRHAAEQAIEAGDTKYTAVAGTPAMKNAIIEKFRRDQNITLTPGEVMASCGGKHILYNAILSLVDPSDEVLIPAPYWVSYPDMVVLAGGKPVFVQPSDQESKRVTAADLERHVTPRTKLIIVNSPNNPSGNALDRAEMKRIAELACERKLFLISDEIYEKLVFGDFRFTSMLDLLGEVPALRERLLIAHGVAKTYSMTGWRIGYAAGPQPLIEAMSALQGASTSNPTSFAQAGAVAALTGPQDAVETMRQAFAKRGELMCQMLRDIPGVRCAQPRGAFYAFPDFSALLGPGRIAENDGALGALLLEKHFIAVVPGGEFGAPGHLRLSFATSEAEIEKGLTRLKKALQ
jgi:aspartate aminotransferase